MTQIDWEYGSIENDLEDMRELGRYAWSENAITRNFDVNADYNLYDDYFALCEQRGILKVLVGRDRETRELVGMYAAILAPWMFCRHLTVSSEIVWYIRQDYMNKGNVSKFFRAAEVANAEWGADYMNMTIVDRGNVDRAREKMRKNGYIMTNLSFIKEIKE